MLRDTKKSSYELVPVSHRDADDDDDDEYLDPPPETASQPPFSFSGTTGTTLTRRAILMGVLLLFTGYLLGKWSSSVTLFAAPKKSPNSSPKKSRFEDMMQFASDYSSAKDLQNVMSPQFRAVQWLALDLDTKEAIFLGHELLQQYVMRVLSLSLGLDWTFFYHRTVCQSLHPPERPQTQQATTRTYGTANQRPKKQWHEYINYGFRCSGQDHISKIELDAGFVSNPWLNGTIPTELVYLSHLTSLKLSNVRRIGTVPLELGFLTSLTSLVLSANNFTASTIPKELGNLSSLKVLSLAGNHLTGSVPTELTRLTDLEELYLEVTDLTGEIPAAFCKAPFDFARGRGYGRHGLEVDCFSKVQCSCCTRCCDREGMCTYSGGSSPFKWEP